MQVNHASDEGQKIISTCFSVKCRLFYKRIESVHRIKELEQTAVLPPKPPADLVDIEDLAIQEEEEEEEELPMHEGT